jgi:hypothetical protein
MISPSRNLQICMRTTRQTKLDLADATAGDTAQAGERQVEAAEPARREADVLIVPVYEERVVKQLFLAEEIHVTQHSEADSGQPARQAEARRSLCRAFRSRDTAVVD